MGSRAGRGIRALEDEVGERVKEVVEEAAAGYAIRID